MSALGEFELIRRFFERAGGPHRAPLGIGDDCALLDVGTEGPLAVSTDMLVAGRHFFDDVDPEALGHKALAVNLSDLAAMGARPLAFTLALALPSADEAWLGAFARGLFALADAHGCELVGGDTTRGPLNLCITVFGTVPAALALRRDRARAGDDLWVSGMLGAASWAVAERLAAGAWPAGGAGSAAAALDAARRRLERPEPRVALGLALRGVAHAAIDLSDGLSGDLGHLLERSSAACGTPLGATLEAAALPVDASLGALPDARRLDFALAGGDDYELLFAAPATARDAVAALGARCGLTLARVGRIDAVPGVRLAGSDGRVAPLHARSFDHFR
ncbi:MAG: Thiamine-monophosphate kinase [Pseudomonadota bacterium]|jgi:thiamine-monophosphate kinase